MCASFFSHGSLIVLQKEMFGCQTCDLYTLIRKPADLAPDSIVSLVPGCESITYRVLFEYLESTVAQAGIVAAALCSESMEHT